MFEFVSGGACQCCGFNHLFLPDGLKSLVDACTDLETDAANNELAAAEKSPWPPEMRNQVWADRVRLRTKMKREMADYRKFFDKNERSDVERWCIDTLGAKGLRRLFQMPRKEISPILGSGYNIHSAYAIVLCAVAEQVANFKVTKFGIDARGVAEIAFEELLAYDRRGGFILPINEGNMELCATTFMDMMVSLSGPKLLARAPKVVDGPDHEEGDADGPDNGREQLGEKGPSFRSDRRMVRLLIARYWANRIIDKYNADVNASPENDDTMGSANEKENEAE
eukprot:CAMPEP_0195514940 /NCGR_PEP_ID=MMETSP0794_2-20130614/6173_1 /TAXON_ID=515487 /ORGANISM="Stephanopyxis turris, Strain CCMP 815" /LENGTH=281 /DNA_ID=CAMNT_0040643299 /DNA_START=158 /DNA_END=1003 /DNA_ORIENTATION=-